MKRKGERKKKGKKKKERNRENSFYLLFSILSRERTLILDKY